MKTLSSFLFVFVAGIGFTFAQTAATPASSSCCKKGATAEKACCKSGASAAAETKSCGGGSHAATAPEMKNEVVTRDVAAESATQQPRVVRRVGAKGVKPVAKTSSPNK